MNGNIIQMATKPPTRSVRKTRKKHFRSLSIGNTSIVDIFLKSIATLGGASTQPRSHLRRPTRIVSKNDWNLPRQSFKGVTVSPMGTTVGAMAQNTYHSVNIAGDVHALLLNERTGEPHMSNSFQQSLSCENGKGRKFDPYP